MDYAGYPKTFSSARLHLSSYQKRACITGLFHLQIHRLPDAHWPERVTGCLRIPACISVVHLL
jgi:hypothetical protein